MENINIYEQLRETDLFKGIQENEMDLIFKCMSGYQKSYKKGEYIFLEQEEIRNVGVIFSGAVHMIKEDIWGNTTILTRIEKGQLIGETFACGSDIVSNVTFRAAANTEIVFLPFERIMRTCNMACGFHHRMVENMVTVIADKNRALMEELQIISKKTLREKILAYLSMESQRQNKRYLEIPLGRIELAEYLCTDRSSLTRELNKMRDDGIIDFEKNIFRLL